MIPKSTRREHMSFIQSTPNSPKHYYSNKMLQYSRYNSNNISLLSTLVPSSHSNYKITLGPPSHRNSILKIIALASKDDSISSSLKRKECKKNMFIKNELCSNMDTTFQKYLDKRL